MKENDNIVPDTENDLLTLYAAFRPVGSGPLMMMRVIRALLREIARLRGYQTDFTKVL